jgi:hypothetical protein
MTASFESSNILSSRIDFPGLSKSNLGLNSNQFEALKLVLRLLDTVFRFADTNYFQGNRNSVASHSISVANRVKELFKPVVNLDLDELNKKIFERAERSALLSALLHDAGEAIMEFSTLDSRVLEDEPLNTKARHALERDIAKVVFSLALDTARSGDEKILTQPIAELRQKIQDNPKEFLTHIQAFLKTYEVTDQNQDLKTFMDAFDRVENRDDLIGVLVKNIDHIDGNDYLSEHGVNLRSRPISILDKLSEKSATLITVLKGFRSLIDKSISDLITSTNKIFQAHGLNLEQLRSIST